MITVDTYSTPDIRMKFWREYFDAGPGPNVAEGNGSSPTPPPAGGNNLIWGAGDPLVWGAGNNLIWGTA